MARFLLREVPRVAVRLVVAFALFGLVGTIPWPAAAGSWIATASFASLAATVLVLCGKLLYDTLFYDRYWRQIDSR
jgi:hypothetical protein